LTMNREPTIPIAMLLATCLAPTGCQDLRMNPDGEPAPLIADVVEEFKLDEPGESWAFRTPELWRIAVEGERRCLRMAAPPGRAMLPGVRRPQEYAIYTRYQFRSFNLSCRVRVDCPASVVGRDACIIFARRDDTHFYYVHLSNVADEFHNAVVRVDGETRTSLVPRGKHPPLTVPGKDWHKVDIIRDVEAGTITVYVDAHDPKDPPWIQVEDRTYDWGYIGLGSFNDQASFARLRIEGQARFPGPRQVKEKAGFPP